MSIRVVAILAVVTATLSVYVGQTTSPTPGQLATQSALSTPTAELTDPTPTAERVQSPPLVGLTRIVIDGDPSDWANYSVLTVDPIGDSTGGVDVMGVSAFSNDTYLYLLFEVAGEIGSYVQIDVDINPSPPDGWPPDYMANARSYEDPIPHLSRIVNKEFQHLGSHGDVAQESVFEMRIPLTIFAGPVPETVSLRVMDGECCGPEWIAVDWTDPVPIQLVDEIEAPLVTLTDLTAPDSAFCTEAMLADTASFLPAEAITVPEGYTAQYFVPPSGVNVPSDVVVMPDGTVLVASSRARAIHEIEADGNVLVYAMLHAYSLDLDAAGTLYGYNFPDGQIFRITRGGEGTLVARMPQTACESTMAVGADGTMYVGFNACSGESFGGSSIHTISPESGSPIALIVDLRDEGVQALDVASDGTLFAVIGQALETIDTATGERSRVASLPERSSFHGLVVADDGTAYVSTGDFDSSGRLYRVAPGGRVDPLASFETNGLEGLAITSDSEIIGTQRAIGGVQIVSPDGSVRALVVPNGLVSPQTLAVSPCGELITVNDESGRLTLAYADGRNIPFTKIISFQPPQSFLAFASEGWYVTAESAPGFPSQVKRYLPNGAREILANDLPNVSGVAVGPDGSLYVSVTQDGKIIRILPDGTREVFAEGLQTPQALALASDSLIYAVTGGQSFGDVFAVPARGDTVVSIAPDGRVTTLAQLEGASGLAIGPDGLIYVAAGSDVFRLSPDGELERFATGFGSARGIAFDVAGNLFIADDDGNNIVRISGFSYRTLAGQIVDQATGKPILDASVRVTLARPPYAGRMFITGADGSLSLPVIPGKYSVTGWADGYQPATVLVTDIDQSVSLELALAE